MTSAECNNKSSVYPAAKCQEVELFVGTVADRNTQTKLTISHKYPHTNSVQYDTGLPPTQQTDKQEDTRNEMFRTPDRCNENDDNILTVRFTFIPLWTALE